MQKSEQKTRAQHRRAGATLLAIVVGLILLSILGAVMAAMIHRGWTSHTQAYDIMRARYLAESGIEYALSTGNLAALEAGDTVTVQMGDSEQFTISVSLADDVYRIRSVGSTGVGSNRETHRVQIRGSLPADSWNPDEAPPSVGESDVESVVDDLEDGMDNWDVTKGTGRYSGFEIVDIPTLSSVLGGSDGMISTDLSSIGAFMENDPEESAHWVGHQILYFNLDAEKQALFESAWSTNSYQMSYEAQVKMAWYKDREYGAQGLAVLLESERDVSNDKSDSYYISLMRYADEDETGRQRDSGTYNYDGIPNSIKPPNKAGKRLLVVWKQAYAANNNTERTWIAYKDLEDSPGLAGEDAIDWVADYNDGYSGQGFKDMVTLDVRVVEARFSDKKYHYLQVLRADPKRNGGTRTANTEGQDINGKRKVYLPQLYADVFPQWSPIDFDDWEAEQDYFSLVNTVAWDGVNTNGQTAIVIMPDGGTIRTEELPTADSGDWSDDRYEIGLHATGNFNANLANEMYFDEFALRFLVNKAAGSGGSGGGVSYHE